MVARFWKWLDGLLEPAVEHVQTADVELILSGLRSASRSDCGRPRRRQLGFDPRDPPRRPSPSRSAHLGERRRIGHRGLEFRGQEHPTIVEPNVGIERKGFAGRRFAGTERARAAPASGPAPLGDTSSSSRVGLRPLIAATPNRLAATTRANTPSNRMAMNRVRCLIGGEEELAI